MDGEISNVELTDDEKKLLYAVEVLGLSVQRAGEVAGVSNPHNVLMREHVAVARTQYQAAMRVRARITKDEVVQGMKAAVDQAVVLADPMAQIAGWREIAKLLGYDNPKQVELTIKGGTASEIRSQLSRLDDSQLSEMLDAGDVIDVDFYEVRKKPALPGPKPDAP